MWVWGYGTGHAVFPGDNFGVEAGRDEEFSHACKPVYFGVGEDGFGHDPRLSGAFVNDLCIYMVPDNSVP
jgi:hypothetical protein